MSSTASAPWAARPGTSAAASPIDGSTIQVTVVLAGAGMVSITASAMKASVPSDPTMSRRKIPSGVSASSRADSA
jgi:hypothetical protein